MTNRTSIAMPGAFIIVILALLAFAPAKAQQQLTISQAKALECLLAQAMKGEQANPDPGTCSRQIRNRQAQAKVLDALAIRLHQELGFEGTIDVLAQLGGNSEELQRVGTTFSFRDSSFVGYANNLYRTFPEVSEEILVDVLRKHGAFTRERLGAEAIVQFKSAVGEQLTDEDLIAFLISDYPSELPNYKFSHFHRGLKTEPYRKNITDFATNYLENNRQPNYRALAERDHTLIDFLNFLALFADDHSLQQVGTLLSQRLDRLDYASKLEIIFVLYRLGRDKDLYFEADSTQCYSMLASKPSPAFKEIEDYCLGYLQDTSYFHAKVTGKTERGQGSFSANRLNGGFHYYSHDLYLRHKLESEGIEKINDMSSSLKPLDRARVLTYAAIFLNSNKDWAALEQTLALLRPLNGSILDEHVASSLAWLDVESRRHSR